MRRRIGILVCVLIVLCGARIMARDLVGMLQIEHRGLQRHVFKKAYVFVRELGVYYEVEEDGRFVVPDLEPGIYNLQSFVPGFTPAFRKINHPESSAVVVPISLQVVSLRAVITQEVPAYVARAQQSVGTSSLSDFSGPGPSDFNEAVMEPDGPDLNIDLSTFGEFVQNRRDDDKRSKQ